MTQDEARARVERLLAEMDACESYDLDAQALRLLLSAGERTCGTCAWTEDEDEGKWDTACGHAYCFIADGPRENGTVYCQYCGGTVTLKEPQR